MERRLAAIMVADVAGYSRLMGENEAGTLDTLKKRRREIFAPLVAEHQGRIIKLMGDGALVEFSSANNAVTCAIAVQKAMADANRNHPGEHPIELRIGVNLGDVIVEGSDIYGDGVNIAARVQTLASNGGICISGKVFDEVNRKLECRFEDLGLHELHNIASPVRVVRVECGNAAAATPASQPVAIGTKPSIIVLPFVNMSGDPEQEFFADGLTEDILTELSRFRELFVISRTSSFKYKGAQKSAQQIAAEMNVQYVAEGSVRKSGNQVRITVQLIDATTDGHVWAERYDRKLEDIFAIQDEITAAIVATLPGRIEAATNRRASQKPTESMAAYECLLAGKTLHHRSTRDDNGKALWYLDRAIELDPRYAQAHAWRACTLGQAWVYGFCADRDETWNEVVAELGTALALDDNDSDVHRILAAVHLAHDEFDKARYHQERALSLNANDDLIVVQQGELLTWFGEPEEGIGWIRKAMQLNPYHPERFWSHLGRAHFVAGQHAEAIDAFRRVSKPDQAIHAFLAACHAATGDAVAATAHREAALKLAPDFSIAEYAETLHYLKDEGKERHCAALAAAGFR
ncbi:MAG: adenylate/guanylate cyclase domain-containing protein [Dongiaceae bacterium]